MTRRAFFTIFGSTGFIGSYIAQVLRLMGYECYLPAKDDFGVFSRPLGNVIYAVGVTSDFRLRPMETIEAHVCLLKDILEKCAFESLTYLSSSRVYSGSNYTAEDATLTVNPNNPSDLYNLSKLMGESLCLNCGHKNMKIARLSNVVGIRGDANTFLEQLLSEGVESGKITLKTSLDSKKDYLRIDDAVKATIDLALSDEVGIFNVAAGKTVTNQEIVNIIKQTTNFDISVEQNAPTWSFKSIDIHKIQNRFDFNPMEFEKYFPNLIQLYLQRGQHGIF